jgi:excisionase family DNA binding protein
MTTQWLSVEDIANDLGVKIDTVRGWIREKKLPAYKIGRDYKIKPEDYKKFLEDRRTTKDTEE